MSDWESPDSPSDFGSVISSLQAFINSTRSFFTSPWISTFKVGDSNADKRKTSFLCFFISLLSTFPPSFFRTDRSSHAFALNNKMQPLGSDLHNWQNVDNLALPGYFAYYAQNKHLDRFRLNTLTAPNWTPSPHQLNRLDAFVVSLKSPELQKGHSKQTET